MWPEVSHPRGHLQKIVVSADCLSGLVKAVENVAKLKRDSFSEALPILLAASQCDEASSGEWYAIQTRYRCEKKVTRSLDRKGLETFIPLLVESHRWSDRTKAIHTRSG